MASGGIPWHLSVSDEARCRQASMPEGMKSANSGSHRRSHPIADLLRCDLGFVQVSLTSGQDNHQVLAAPEQLLRSLPSASRQASMLVVAGCIGFC
jgi:hypothetical protein